MSSQPPKVSVVMAVHNAGDYLALAIASVRAQTLADFELILSDDGSQDGSLERAQEAAAADPRVRVISGASGGPAVARNRALDAARGAWIAIVDADDLLHPTRFARLIDRAEALEVEMIADDLVHFGAETGRSLLQPLALSAPWRVTARELLAAETSHPPVPLGYLKPLIRREAIGAMRYRTELRIGEDFDFLLRLTLSGARLAVLPEAYYLYRRHTGSISHRLSEPAARAMIDAQDALTDAGLGADLADLLQARRARLQQEAAFAGLVAQLRSLRVGAAARRLIARPSLAGQLWRARAEGRQRAQARAVPAVSRIDLRGQALPPRAADWPLSDVLDLVAKGNGGRADVLAEGRAGLAAVGYLPGWSGARLRAPTDGWSEAEAAQITALPWPVVGDRDGP